MKKPMKLFACGTTALFAAALTLQAQTSGAGTSGTTGGAAAGTGPTSNVGSSSQTMPSSSPQSTSQFGTSSGAPSTGTSATAPQSSGSQVGSSSANATSSTQFGTAPSNPSTPTGANSGFNTTTPNTSTTQSFNATGNMNTSTNANLNSSSATSTTQSTYAAGGGGYTTVSDGQVTTFVQQFDSMGPDVIVQRASSDLGDLACSQDTVQNLVQALHTGQSVTITSNVDGQQQSATFNPEGVHMGYGEAYLTLAMAAQELRDAGVSTCATPEQWNSVLMGGPLNVTSTSTTVNSSASASGSRQVQGIVTLRKQGEGWGQIAQSNNVQLGQVINSGTSQTGAQSGFSNSQAEQGNVNANGTVEDNGSHKTHKKHWWNRNKDKENKDSSSTHADNAAKPDNQ